MSTKQWKREGGKQKCLFIPVKVTFLNEYLKLSLLVRFWSHGHVVTRKAGKAVFAVDSHMFSSKSRTVTEKQGGSRYRGATSHLCQKSDGNKCMFQR